MRLYRRELNDMKMSYADVNLRANLSRKELVIAVLVLRRKLCLREGNYAPYEIIPATERTVCIIQSYDVILATIV